MAEFTAHAESTCSCFLILVSHTSQGILFGNDRHAEEAKLGLGATVKDRVKVNSD